MRYADLNALLCELGQNVIIKDPATGQERADTVIRTADLCGEKVPSPWVSAKDALPKTGESALVVVGLDYLSRGITMVQYLGSGKWRPVWSAKELEDQVLFWMPLPDMPEVGRPLKALRRMEGKRMNVKTYKLEDGRKYLVPARSCFNCEHLGLVLYDDGGPHTIMCTLSEDEKYADYAADMGLKCDAFEEKEEEKGEEK